MMRGLSIAALLLLTACSFARVESLPQFPTATTLRVAQTTAVPTVGRELHSIPTAVETVESAVQTFVPTNAVVCQFTAGQVTAAHVVVADVDYRQQTVTVSQRVTFLNRTNDDLPALVFDVEPNRAPDVFTLNGLTFGDGSPVSAYEVTGRRLTVELPTPVAPGCTVDVALSFLLRVPPIGQGIKELGGYLGFSRRQFNLGHWLPTVAPRVDGEWIIRDASVVGEQTIADPADWDVTLNVQGASDALKVAAPGVMTPLGGGSWRFVQTNARDFALSLSEEFNLVTQTTSGGVMVEVYTFDDALVQGDAGVIDGGAHALEMATRSLTMFSDLFGAYPRQRFILVQGDFPDGMEFSDLVFVSGDWFRTYAGSPTSYLTIITVHEVAHQWWYAQVGNDQATAPWLDEALATYSEYVFYEEVFPELKDWWWQFRVDTFIPEGFDTNTVDSTVYEFQSVRAYINAVYLRGARMLRDLRSDLGTEAFFAWIRRYAEVGGGRVVTPAVFWSLLTPEQLEITRQTRERYLESAETAQLLPSGQ